MGIEILLVAESFEGILGPVGKSNDSEMAVV
jgi:hypothetical protein